MSLGFCIIYSVFLFFVCRADVISEFMLFQVGDCFCWDVRSGVTLCVALISFQTFIWLPGFDGKFRWISEHMVFMPACSRVRVANGCLNRAFFWGCYADYQIIQFQWKQLHCQVRKLGSCVFYQWPQLLNGAGSGFVFMAYWHCQCSGKLFLPSIPWCSTSFACPFSEKWLTVCCGWEVWRSMCPIGCLGDPWMVHKHE